MIETRLLIGGEQVSGEGGALPVENPYTESELASVRLPSREQIDAAVAAAREAARGWAATPAIELANSTRFGLGANVYTKDLDTILRCMRELKAGTVWFNDPLTDNDAGPFGGMKQSGFGRELGQEGLEAFQETKHVHLETSLAPKDWWSPYGGGSSQATGT